jgi:hypothetical protein
MLQGMLGNLPRPLEDFPCLLNGLIGKFMP